MGNTSVKKQTFYYSLEDEQYNFEYLREFERKKSIVKVRMPIKCLQSKTFVDRGNSTVVCQWDQNNGENVAVKRINCLFLSPEQKKSILMEAKLQESLDHPNIVRFLDCKEDGNFILIYLEFMELGSIRDKINEHGRLTENLTRVYLEQILRGLEYLHVKGIMHRDLKCANILHNSEGTIKLTDFGSAKYLTECSGSRVGTSGFSAPEVK